MFDKDFREKAFLSTGLFTKMFVYVIVLSESYV